MTANDLREYSGVQDNPAMFAQRFCRTVHQTPNGPKAHLLPDYSYLNPWWQAFKDQVDVLVEKTRQMGISWTVAASFLHDITFRQGWTVLALSRKERLVDDGGSRSSYQSLLGKVRFIWDKLPDALRAPLEFSYLKIHNPYTQSTIVGESSASEAGRGGSYRRVLLDEAAFIPHGEMVYAAVRQTCPKGLILVSTPSGKSNVFYRIRSSDHAGYQIIRMHWSQHPERRCDCKNGQHRGCWYARQLEDMTPLQIARELDISYEDSVAGKVYYPFGSDFIAPAGSLFQRKEMVWRFWDFGVGDQTAIWFCHVRNLHTATGRLKKSIHIFDAYRNAGMGAKHYREICEAKAEAYEGARVIDIGDPHNLTSRDPGLGSWQSHLRDDTHPYKINVQPSNCRGVPIETVVDNARKFMQFVECQDGKHRPRLQIDGSLRAAIDCLENWSYPVDEEGRIIGQKPAHDENSHWGTALYYGCWNIDPTSGIAQKIKATDALILPREEAYASEVW